MGVLEAERQALAERCSRLDESVRKLQDEASSLKSERRQLDETVRRQEAQVQALQLERAAQSSLEERFRDMQQQRDAAEQERSQVQEELAATIARHAGLEQTCRSAESALKAVQHELDIERGKERERDERVRAFQNQRDTVQRERAKLQEQCNLATAEARAASEREHALFIRTTVLEQQLSSATSRAASVGFDEKLFASGGSVAADYPSRSSMGSAANGADGGRLSGGDGGGGGSHPVPPATSPDRADDGPAPSIEAALQTLGSINKRWSQ